MTTGATASPWSRKDKALLFAFAVENPNFVIKTNAKEIYVFKF